MRAGPKISGLAFGVLLVVAALAVSGSALAQEPIPQPPSSSTPPSPATTDSNDQSSGDSTSLDHPPVVTTTTPPIPLIDGAGFLGPTASPVRFGPLYVRYGQFAQIFSRGTSISGLDDFQNTASQFSAGIVFDKAFRKTNIVIQYVPRVTIFRGEIYPNFINQDTSVSLAFALTPRLALTLSDHFVYYRSNNAFVDIFLDSDPVSGGTYQRDFINGLSTWLMNTLSAPLSYAMTARTRITVAPRYVYATTSGEATSATIPTVHEYALNVNVSHDLTARSSISGLYTLQVDISPGSSFKTIYQTVEAGYSHSFNGGWSISGAFGLGTVKFETGRTWSPSGSGSLSKTFRHSRAALGYFRGHSFSGYISREFSDRIDANYQQNIGRRLLIGGGAGYMRDIATVNGVWGKYAQANVSFGLTSTLSLFSTYVHKWQRGDDVQVFNGNTDFVRFGIQWIPRQATR